MFSRLRPLWQSIAGVRQKKNSIKKIIELKLVKFVVAFSTYAHLSAVDSPAAICDAMAVTSAATSSPFSPEHSSMASFLVSTSSHSTKEKY